VSAYTDPSLNLIAELSNANGASGFEDEVLAVVRRHAEGLGAISEDCLRNIYVEREGGDSKGPVVMLDAHSDEVSFMVQAIKPNGTLQFISLGRWVENGVAAHRVRVRNRDGIYLPGIVATKPPHYMTEEEKKQAVPLSDMSIDVGACSREEAIRDFGIRIGEPVVPDVCFEADEQRDLLFGKAFDNRLGCAAVIGTMRALAGEQLGVRLVGAIASQEEVGTRGATVTANRVKPDVAIVFEGCPADDTFAEPYLVQTAIKKGPMLRHIDARMITNPRFQRFALGLAEELGIPAQEGVRTGGSTNGAPIHLSNLGVPVIVIGLPVRYIHTHYGIASLSDYKNAVALGCAVVRKLGRGLVRGF
jgi:putative aminopeptidase FrvX